MKVVVIGGTGLVGSRLTSELRRRGADVSIVSRTTENVDLLEPYGLADAFDGVDVVIDTLNTSAMDSVGATQFFKRAAGNISAAETEAHVPHHILLSIIGLELATRNGHYIGKLAQEQVVKRSGIPYTIVRSAQFFEFLPSIAEFFVIDGEVQLPRTLVQPVAVNDVVMALADAAESAAVDDTIEIAGPEQFPIVEAVRIVLSSDPRPVIEVSGYEAFGVDTHDALVPTGIFRKGDQWLKDWTVHRDSSVQKSE